MGIVVMEQKYSGSRLTVGDTSVCLISLQFVWEALIGKNQIWPELRSLMIPFQGDVGY